MALRRSRALIALAAAAGMLSACAHASQPESGAGAPQLASESKGGFLGFGHKKKKAPAGSEIGVNSFLWRATLDTLSFMPLASEDPYGGVIITDWYANPERPNERFKATVYILDTRLRADGLKVSINRQQLTANGWTDAVSDPDTAIQIENKILARARELRLSTLQG
jgi:hypothetical protein